MSHPTLRDRLRVLDALYATILDVDPLPAVAVRAARSDFEAAGENNEDALIALIDALSSIGGEYRTSEVTADLISLAQLAITGKDEKQFWNKSHRLNGLVADA